LGPRANPLTVVALSGVRISKHADLGHFETVGGIELTKVGRLIRRADGPWSL
jgi:hypothetical protein